MGRDQRGLRVRGRVRAVGATRRSVGELHGTWRGRFPAQPAVSWCASQVRHGDAAARGVHGRPVLGRSSRRHQRRQPCRGVHVHEERNAAGLPHAIHRGLSRNGHRRHPHRERPHGARVAHQGPVQRQVALVRLRLLHVRVPGVHLHRVQRLLRGAALQPAPEHPAQPQRLLRQAGQPGLRQQRLPRGLLARKPRRQVLPVPPRFR